MAARGVNKLKVSKIPNNSENDEFDCGQLNWKKDQSYEGEFFEESFHGEGLYRWNHTAIYEGSFYSNFKEGYALLSLPNNSYFEGLFIKNQPFGPGILTHGNGRQDAGFWVGRKLVRLSRSVDFIIPRLAPTSAAKIKLLQFRRLIPLDEVQFDSTTEILNKYSYSLECFFPYSPLIHDPRSVFFDKFTFKKTYFIRTNEFLKELSSSSKDSSAREQSDEGSHKEESDGALVPPSFCLCPDEVFFMEYKKQEKEDICGEEVALGENKMGLLAFYTKYGAFGPFEDDEDKGTISEWEDSNEDAVPEESGVKYRPFPPKIVSWNRSALCTEMLKHIFRYRAFEEKLNFKIAKLMLGVRTAFRRTGEKEKLCLQFLKMCSLGPPHAVKELLCGKEISEELMDARGNNGLMFAAVTDQHEIIDLLLDYGVDVNTFNDEGLTPLNLCLLRRLAQVNKVSNWETAFLPTELNVTPDENSSTEEWRTRESIQSLDRIFGDGMSINNSDVFMHQYPLSGSGKGQQTFLSDYDKDFDNDKNLSQITITLLSCKRNSEINNGMEGISTSEKKKIVPKSPRRDEFKHSTGKSTGDRYLFELCPRKNQISEDNKKEKDHFKWRKRSDGAESTLGEEDFDSDLITKIKEIDRTIEKLLQRGADPNISEVPKPSIHLAVFTKDVNVVHTLLVHGASPNHQLYSNEGLLTPLHVLALLNPAQEYVDICRLLLSFGANPDEETLPEFSICECEKSLLDTSQGRTPLQLLCMRPDLEQVDPQGFLTQIALMLAKVSRKRNFLHGHSYLTLAMMCGNIRLLGALLYSKHFDANDILGRDLGTALHVLVSTLLQMRTVYQDSVKICDLLIAAGADPLKEFTAPESLIGTCVDYGYREIEEEKAKRKSDGTAKSSKTEKGGVRDHLKDHTKTVEYLSNIALNKKVGSDDNFGIIEVKANEYENTYEKSEKNKWAEGEGGRVDWIFALQNKSSLGQNVEKSQDSKTSRKKEKMSKGTEPPSKKQKKGNVDFILETQTKNSYHEVKDGKDFRGGKKKKDFSDKNKTSGKKSKKIQKNKRHTDTKKTARKTVIADTQGKTLADAASGKGRREWRCEGKSNTRVSKSLTSRCSETFPEKLRQSLLRMFGGCVDVDVNEFLLPYVVLRDGDFYYRFQGKATQRKEQYSLV